MLASPCLNWRRPRFEPLEQRLLLSIGCWSDCRTSGPDAVWPEAVAPAAVTSPPWLADESIVMASHAVPADEIALAALSGEPLGGGGDADGDAPLAAPLPPELAFGFAMPTGSRESDEGRAVATDDDGNVYVAGRFRGVVDFDPGAGTHLLDSLGNDAAFVAKYKPDGTFVWATAGAGTGDVQANGLAVDRAGNSYAVGQFAGKAQFGTSPADLISSAGLEDIFIAALTPEGAVRWVQRLGGSARDVANGVALDSRGNVLTTGAFVGPVDFDPGAGDAQLIGSGSGSIFVEKLDSLGRFVWAGGYGDRTHEEGFAVATDRDDNVYVTGQLQGVVDFNPSGGPLVVRSNGLEDAFLLKLDPAGRTTWAHGIGGSGTDRGLGVAVDPVGTVNVTGFFSETVDFDPFSGVHALTADGGTDVFVSSLDPLGRLRWVRGFGSSAAEEGLAVATDADGDVYTIGRFIKDIDFDPGLDSNILHSAGDFDVFLSHLDSSGDHVGAYSFGGKALDSGQAVAVHSSRGVFVTGLFAAQADFDPDPGGQFSLTSAGDSDVFLVSLNMPVNQPPTTTGIADVEVVPGTGKTFVDLFPAFDDAEDLDEDLTLTVEGNTNPVLLVAATIDPSEGQLTLEYAPGVLGEADVTVRATDTGGEFVETTFHVTVDFPTVTWDGGGDGRHWHNPLNWSTDVVPDGDDNVIIDVPGELTVVISDASGVRSVRSLTSQENVAITGGGLSVLETGVIDGNVQLSGGELGGGGEKTIGGLLTWTGGSLGTRFNNTGIVNLNGGVMVSGDNDKSFAGGTYNNAANFTWTGSGNLMVNTGGTFNNLASGTFDVQTDADVVRSNGTLNFFNSGLFVKSGGTGTTSYSPAFSGFNNDGVVRVETGTFQLSHGGSGGEGSGSGAFDVQSGATLQISAASHTYDVNSRLDVAAGGTLVVDGGTFSLGGTVNVGGETIITGGVLHFTGDAATTHLADVQLSGGELGGEGGKTVNGLLTWTGGTLGTPFNNTGVVHLDGGVTVSGDADKFFGGGTYNNAANFIWDGIGNLVINTGGTFENLPGAVFDIRSDSQLLRTNGTFNFTNRGLVLKSQGTGTTNVNYPFGKFDNQGTIQVENGTLHLSKFQSPTSGTIRLENGATLSLSAPLTLASDGLLEGAGSVNTSVTSSGSVRPGPVPGLTVAGDYTQLGGARLVVELDKNVAAFTAGELHVGGTATLGGILEVVLNSATTPPDGTVFTIMEAGSIGGAFAATTGLQIGSGELVLGVGPGAITLTASGTGVLDLETLRQFISDGLTSVWDALPGWGQSFNFSSLDGFDLDLPVLTDELSDLFGIGGSGGLLDGLPLPTVDQAATAEELIAALEAAGFEVLCMAGGVGAAADCGSADFLQFRYHTVIPDLAAGVDFDDGTLALLTDLADAANLDGQVSLTAGLDLDFTFGVDASGFFLLGPGGLTLDVRASGEVATSFNLSGQLGIDAAGTATADLAVALSASEVDRRYRPAEFLTAILNPAVDGTASVGLQLTLNPVDLDFVGQWDFTLAANTLETSGGVEFPTQDEMIDALLGYLNGQLDTLLSGDVAGLLDSINIPLTDGLGPLLSTVENTLPKTAAAEQLGWFENLLSSFSHYLQFDVERDPDTGELSPPGTGLHYTNGDRLLGADVLRNDFGLSGAGVRVGVISDGVKGLAKAQRGTHPDIVPGSVTVFSPPAVNGAEGTAMIEIIQDIAPGTEIFFVGVANSSDFVAGLEWLAQNDVQIIVDDVGFPGWSWMDDRVLPETDPVASKIRELLDDPARDILFITAGGNDNANHYQAAFAPDLDFDGPTGPGFYHAFAPGQLRAAVEVLPRATLEVKLQWSDYFDEPEHDFTLALLDDAGNVLHRRRASDYDDPNAYRDVVYTNPSETNDKTVYVVIEAADWQGGEVVLEMLTNVQFDDYATPFDSLYGHPTLDGMLTVGAINAFDQGVNGPASYSARGPTTLYDPVFGDFELRNALDVMGIDAVNVSGAGGFGREVFDAERNTVRAFSGTSAAAPHVAGVAALLQEFRMAEAGAADLFEAITQTATDLTLEPLAVGDVAVVQPGGAVSIDVLANDLDLDEPVAGGEIRFPLELVELVPTEATRGQILLDGDLVRYTPPSDENVRFDQFRYVVEDSEGDRDTGTVSVYIGMGNRPIAVPDGLLVTTTDPTIEFDATANDIDVVDDFLVAETLDVVSDNGGTVEEGTLPGQLVYTAPDGFTGIDHFRYIVRDTLGNPASLGDVTVVVTDIATLTDFVPQAVDDAVLSDTLRRRAIKVLDNDVSPFNPTVTEINIPEEFEQAIDVLFVDPDDLTPLGDVADLVADVGTLDADTLVVAPQEDARPGVYTFTYTIQDDVGTSTATVTVILDDSGRPLAVRDVGYVSGLAEATMEPLANDLNAPGAVLTGGSVAVRFSDFLNFDEQHVTFSPVEALYNYRSTSNEAVIVPFEYTFEVDGREYTGDASFRLLQPTSLRPGYDQGSGHGRVNAPAAYDFLEQRFPEAPAPAAGDGPIAAAAEEAPPVPFHYLDALADFGVVVESVLDDVQIADLLAGRLPNFDRLLQLRIAPDPSEFAPLRGEFNFAADDVGALAGADFDGVLAAELLPMVDLGFGFDRDGFYVTGDTSLGGHITGTASVGGAFGSLSATATGQIELTPRVLLAPVDADADGRIRLAELTDPANFAALDVELGNVTATLGLDLEAELLDYVDADGNPDNNTEFGGDPFRFAASTTLTATVDNGDGVSFEWQGINIANPDVDGNGQDDFTTEVLVENLRRLTQDVVRGRRTLISQDLAAALNLGNLPLSGTGLGDALDVAGALADVLATNVEVIHVATFDEIEDWINFGTPVDVIRMKLDLGSVPLDPLGTLQYDLSGFLPNAGNTFGRVSIQNARLTGDLVFGMDTGPSPLYLVTAPDTISADVTTLGGGLDLVLNLDGLPLGPDLLELNNAEARMTPSFSLDVSGVGDGKLRLGDDPAELAGVRVELGDDTALLLSADGATLLPGGPVSAGVSDDDPEDDLPGLAGSINLVDGTIELSARRLTVGIAGVLELEAAGIDFTYDPQAAPEDDLLRIANAVARLTAAEVNGLAPEAQFSQFGFRQDGRPFASSATFTLPEGYPNLFGLGGLLPVSIQQISATFPNPDDFNELILTVSGEFRLDDFPLPFTPRVALDGVPVDGPFDVSLHVVSLRDGVIRPVEFGPLTVGIDGLAVPGTSTVLGGEVSIGRFNTLGELENLPGMEYPVAGFVEVALSDDLPLGLRIDLAGDVEYSADGTAVLDVIGTAELQPGQGPVGTVAANFALQITATPLPSDPYLSLDVRAELRDVVLSDIVIDLSPVVILTADRAAFFSNPAAGDPTAELLDVTAVFPSLPDLQPARIASVLGFDEDGTSGIEAFEIHQVSIGVNGAIGNPAEPLFALENLTAVIPFLSNRGGGLRGQILLAADSATVLPNTGGNAGFTAVATGIAGAIDLGTGGVSLGADRLHVILGPALELFADEATLKFDPQATAADAEIVSAERIAVNFSSVPNLPVGYIEGLVIRRNGISIDGFGVLGALAIDDRRTTGQDQPVAIDALANDLSIYGDPLEIASVATDALLGSVEIVGEFQGDGPPQTLRYTPPPGSELTETFRYFIDDGSGVLSSAEVTVAVGDPATAGPGPLARDDGARTIVDEAVVVDVMANDLDRAGGGLTLATVSQPEHGSVVIQGGRVVYLPESGLAGQHRFGYSIRDAEGRLDFATVAVLVVSTSDQVPADPVAIDDQAVTEKTEPVTIAVLANDQSPLELQIEEFDADSSASGTITLTADGQSLLYVPHLLFTGQDTFTYTVRDPLGRTATATVEVLVDPKPGTSGITDWLIANDDAVATEKATPAEIHVLDNDRASGSPRLELAGFSPPGHGSLAAAPDRMALLYTPEPDFTGRDGFSYLVRDAKTGLTATAEVIVAVSEAKDVRFGFPALIEIVDPRLDADVEVTLGSGPLGASIAGTVAVAAGGVSLFPDEETDEFDGVVTARGVRGLISLDDGSFSMEADRAEIDFGDLLVTAGEQGAAEPGLEVHVSEGVNEIAVVRSVQVFWDNPDLGGLPTQVLPGGLNVFTIRRDGFDLNLTLADNAATFGTDGTTLLTMVDPRLDVDLSVTVGQSVELSGTVGISATSATLLPDGPVTASVEGGVVDDQPVPGLAGTLDLATGVLDVDLHHLEVVLGELLHVEADGVDLLFDPQADGSVEMLGVANAVARITALEAGGLVPTVEMDRFGFTHDFRPFVELAELTIPPGYTNALGIAGLLPLEIHSLTLEFPDPADLNAFILRGNGQFLIDQIDQQLDMLLGSDVTPVIHVGDPALTGANDGAVESFTPADNGVFSFRIDVESLVAGQLRPLDVGPITLGVLGINVGTFELDALMTLGGYQDGLWVPEVDGFVQIVDTTVGDADFLDLRLDILPGSTLSFDQASATLDLTAELNFSGGVSGAIVEGTQLSFGLLAEATLSDTAPYVQLTTFQPTFDSLQIDVLVIEVGALLRLTATDIELTANPGPNDPVASLGTVLVEFPTFAELDGGTITNLQIFDDPAVPDDRRVEVGSLQIGVSGDLRWDTLRVLELVGLELLTTDLIVNLDTGSFSAQELKLTADSATLLPDEGEDGLASVIGFSGTFDADGNLRIIIDELNASVADVIEVQAFGGRVDVGPTILASQPLFSIAQATATIPALGDVTFVANGFAITREGELQLDSVGVVSEQGILTSIGVAEFLPLDVNEVFVDFEDAPAGPTNFASFQLSVRGSFDFDNFGLPFTPIVRVGSTTVDPTSPAEENAFDFTIAIDTATGTVRPVDLGPIELGFADFTIGEIALAGSITLGGYANGLFVPSIGGFLEVDFDSPDNHVGDVPDDPELGDTGVSFEGLTIDLTGEFTPAAENNGVTELFVAMETDVRVRFTIADLLELYGVNFAFDVTITNDFSAGFDPTVTPRLNSLGVDFLRVQLGDLFALSATGAQINFTRDEGQPLASVENVGISFPVLAGIGGSIDNLNILEGGIPDFSAIEGVELEFDAGASSLIDTAFQYVPINVERLGVKFFDGLFTRDPSGRITGIDDPTQMALVFSGGMTSVSSGNATIWPLSAELTDIEIDIAKLAAGQFPVTNLGGFEIGLEPIELVPSFTIGGGLKFGVIDVIRDDGGTPLDPTDDVVENVLYGRIFGEFQFKGIGANVEMVITQYGPVAASFGVPLAIVLGQTGIMITGVQGALQFGRTVPSIRDPDELSGDEFDNPIDIDFGDEEVIRSFVTPAVLAGTFTWEQAFTLALAGTVTHAAVGGAISGRVTLAANVGLAGEDAGLKLLGFGDVFLVGLPMAETKLFLDLSDPLAPVFAASFRAPAPNNPFGFLFPGRVDFGALFDTKGLSLAAAVGIRAFAERVAAGTLDVGAEVFDDTLDAMAERLTVRPHAPLARLLRPGLDPQGPVIEPFTRQEILDAVVALVPDDVTELAESADSVVELTAAFTSELFAAMGEVLEQTQEDFQGNVGDIRAATGLDAAGAAAGFEQFILDQLGAIQGSVIGEIARDAMLAFIRVLQEAAVDAIRQVAAVIGGDDLFDPILILRGELQPVIFGIPLGKPLFDTELIVSKRGVSFGAEMSIKELIDKALRFSGYGIVSDLSPPVSDRTFAQVRLPFADDLPEQLADSLIDLLNGRMPAPIDPLSPDWAVVMRGFIDVLGFQVGDLGGMMFPANATDVLTARIQKVWEDPDAPLDPDKFQITEERFYDRMLDHGGILINGGLQIPALLSDPLAQLDKLQNLPDPLQNPFGFIDGLFGGLGEIEETARIQFYMPSFLDLLQFNFDTFTAEDPTDTPPDGGPVIPRIALGDLVTVEGFGERIADYFLDGAFTPKILGIQLADGRIRAEAIPVPGSPGEFTQQLLISGSVPWLAGLQLDLELKGVSEVATAGGTQQVSRDVPVISADNNPLEGLEGFSFDANQPPPSVDLGVPFPAIGATISIDTSRKADDGLVQWEEIIEGLGLPLDVFPSPNINAEAFLRAYSPGFDVAQLDQPEPDLLKVFGGIEAAGEMAIEGLLESAAFTFRMTPPPQNDLIPDFIATASITGLSIPGLAADENDPSPLLTLENFQATLTHDDGGLSLALQGSLNVLGVMMTTTDTHLNIVSEGVYGEIPLTVQTPLGDAQHGFTLDGDFTLQVNTTGTTREGIDPGGRILVVGTLIAAGFTLDGSFSLQVNDEGLQVYADADLGLGLFGSYGANGFLQIDALGLAAEIEVNGGSAVSVNGLGFGLSGQFRFVVNTTGSAVSYTEPDGTPHQIAAGNYARVELDQASLTLFDLPIAEAEGAEFEIVAGAGTFELNVAGNFTFLGNTLTVDQGSLRLQTVGQQTRILGDLVLSMSEPTFQIAGFDVDVQGSLGLHARGTGAAVSLQGDIRLSGLQGGQGIFLDGEIATDGTGFLGATLDQLRIGPQGSALIVSGTIGLRRELIGQSLVTSFGGQNIKIRWEPLNEFNPGLQFNVPSFLVQSNGRIAVDVDPIDFRIGTSSSSNTDFMKLFVGSMQLDVDPSRQRFELDFGGAQLEVPGLFTGNQRLTIPPFSLDTGREFQVVIANQDVDLGAFRVTRSRLVFEREDDAFRLAVEPRPRFSRSRLVIPGPNNDVDVNEFFVDTQGRFTVDLETNRLGPDALYVTGSRLFIAKDGRGLDSFRLRFNGGTLHLPINKTFNLGNFSIDSGALADVSLPLPDWALDFGSALKASEGGNFEFSFDHGALSLSQTSSEIDLIALPGSSGMKLKNFYVDSSGEFSAEVSGRLGVGGYQLAQATLDLSRLGGALKVELPAGDAVGLDLGFASVDFHGFFTSAGDFSFEGNMHVDPEIPFLARFNGDADFTIDNGGFDSNVSGSLEAWNVFAWDWLEVASFSTSLTQAGCLTAGGFSFPLAPGACGSVLSITDVTVAEGDSGTKDMVFLVTLSPPDFDHVINVPVSVIAATATAGEDYQTNFPNSITFGAGVAVQTFKVKIVGDGDDEDDETLQVVLGATPFAVIADGVGLGTIEDDDLPTLIYVVVQMTGRVFDGYGAGATVFFDVNGNRVRDFQDLNGNGVQDPDELDEPSAETGADGGFKLLVPADFDANGNGIFEPDEGVLVSFGGVDTATTLPLPFPLTAPGGSTVVTPLTTLITRLIADHGLDPVNAAAVVREHFALPLVDLTGLDAIEAAVDFDADAGPVFAAGAQTQDTVLQIAELLQGAAAVAIPDGAEAAFRAFAARLLDTTTLLDLADTVQLESLIQQAAVGIGVNLDPGLIGPAASVIAAGNAAIAAIDPTGDLQFIRRVTEVQRVAQDTVADDLQQAAAGTISTDELVDHNTGDALDEQIVQAETGNVVPPEILIADVELSEGNGPTTVFPFAVRLSRESALPVSVVYATRNGSATLADGDYRATSGRLEFAPGEMEKVIEVEVITDDMAEADESFFVELDLPEFGTLARSRGFGLILDDDTSDEVAPISRVDKLPEIQPGPNIAISVAAFDVLTESQSEVSGLASVDVFVSTDGGPFVLWTMFLPGQLGQIFEGDASVSYAFYSVAKDHAGNVEPTPQTPHATTRVPEFTPPDTRVDAVDTSGFFLEVDFSGSDDGSGLDLFVVFVSVDGGEPEPVRGVPAGQPDGLGRYTGTAVYGAIADGTPHTYRFFTTGLDADGNQETSPSGPANDVLTTASFPSPIVGRHVFYNNSNFDGNDPLASAADDAAMATDKTALLPGQTAAFANYTSYSRGINGIMVDLNDRPDTDGLDADDFEFRVGNGNDPGLWHPAPAPTSVTVREGAGVDGSDRISIAWPDGEIRNQWLEVTVLATSDTGIPRPDVFYFGNAVAEAGNSATDVKVSVTDLLLARNNPRNLVSIPADVTFPYDFDRDGHVNATDVLLARNNQTGFLNALKLIDLSDEAEEAQGAPLSKLAWLTDLDQPATQRSAEKDAAADAVDMLLATYWPE